MELNNSQPRSHPLFPADTDSVYGLGKDEIVRLPYDPIPMWKYIRDMILGTITVGQAVLITFICECGDNCCCANGGVSLEGAAIAVGRRCPLFVRGTVVAVGR